MADLRQKTLSDLEWHRIVAAVRSRCVGPGAESPELPIAASRAGAILSLEETREAMALANEGDPIPLTGLRNVAPHLVRVERMGALDGPGLRDVQATLANARTLRRFLGRNRERAPRLFAACSTDPSLDRLEEELSACVEPDGTLADHASPDLRSLRTETANLRGRLVARLEELVHKHADLLSDTFHTIREGRYVLPVRRDAHERLPGIVHGTSSSGATVYLEPRALIPQGNRLKMAQAEMEREEARILAMLSDLVRERVAEVRAAAEALDHADLRAASARFGNDLGARVLPVAETAKVHLRVARHPVLVLDGVNVVPGDLDLGSGRAIVISGPNAGGKTVALKTLGLVALMVRAGLPVLAGDGSECGFFHPVLTDVGDDQSLTKSLSTFSAHVTNLAGILRDAGPQSLVLLDELATGTDPEEGAALACAVVDGLCRRKAAVAVTTHYEALKALALRDERLENASVGFDVSQMAPTFELLHGVPGASNALAVAARFGIPEDVLDTARRVLPEQSRTFEDLVRKLEDARRELAIERAGVTEERQHAERARAAAERELETMRSRDRDRLSAEADKLLSLVRKARDEVKEARQRLRQQRATEAEITAAKQKIEEAVREAYAIGARDEPREPAQVLEPVRAEELDIGQRVWVGRLRAEAEIVELPNRGRVRVAAGAMKLWVDLNEVKRPAGPGSNPKDTAKPERAPPPAREPAHRLAPQSKDNTIDVRGMRVDEAVALVESQLDRLYGAAEPTAYVVHGHGTGALREAIRQRLKDDVEYTAGLRAGNQDEGGEGVTVVFLR